MKLKKKKKVVWTEKNKQNMRQNDLKMSYENV